MADVIMSSGAASKVVGPRPGKAACSFTEGVIEIVLRVLNGVSITRSFSFPCNNMMFCRYLQSFPLSLVVYC